MTLGVKFKGIPLPVNERQKNCFGKEECLGVGMEKSFHIWITPNDENGPLEVGTEQNLKAETRVPEKVCCG